MVVTFAVGVMSIFFALAIESILDILIYAYTYWAPVVLVPLVATIYGLRKGVAGFVAGALVRAVRRHDLGQRSAPAWPDRRAGRRRVRQSPGVLADAE